MTSAMATQPAAGSIGKNRSLWASYGQHAYGHTRVRNLHSHIEARNRGRIISPVFANAHRRQGLRDSDGLRGNCRPGWRSLKFRGRAHEIFSKVTT